MTSVHFDSTKKQFFIDSASDAPGEIFPKEFGNWNKIYKRFNECSRGEKLMTIFKALAKDPDMEWKLIDGSIVKAHQHSSGARRGHERGIGKSSGGNSSKIHMVTDSHGNPIDFEITEGQVHDIQMATELLERTPRSDYTIADKGYDANYLRWVIRECQSIPVIPRKKNSISKNKNIIEIFIVNDIEWKISLQDLNTLEGSQQDLIN